MNFDEFISIGTDEEMDKFTEFLTNEKQTSQTGRWIRHPGQ